MVTIFTSTYFHGDRIPTKTQDLISVQKEFRASAKAVLAEGRLLPDVA